MFPVFTILAMLAVNLYPEALVFGLAITGNSCQDIRHLYKAAVAQFGTFTSLPQNTVQTPKSCPNPEVSMSFKS